MITIQRDHQNNIVVSSKVVAYCFALLLLVILGVGYVNHMDSKEAVRATQDLKNMEFKFDFNDVEWRE